MMWRSPSPQGYVAPVIDMQQVSELAPFLRPCGHTHRTAQRSNADNKAQPCMMELPWHQVVSKRPACSSSRMPGTSVWCLPAGTRWPSVSIH